MNRYKKVGLGALALALPAALLLTSCSGGDGDAQSPEDDNTLTVWAWDPAFNIYALEEAEKIYQQDNPDFELEIVEVPWEDLQTRLTTLAQSQAFDELPDIFLMQNNAFQKNAINYPDLFSDLDGADVDFSEFPDSVVAYSTLDGLNYGVPFDAGTAITALRTDVLQEAGYTIDDFTDITWETFIEQGKDVLAKTGTHDGRRRRQHDQRTSADQSQTPRDPRLLGQRAGPLPSRVVVSRALRGHGSLA